MKIEKGMPGYIQRKKKKELLKTLISFSLVLALILLGYFQTGTKLNWFTLFAILGCLPASRTLVGLIMLAPRHSIDLKMADELKEKASQLTQVFDLVLTSEKTVMPVDAIVIYNHNICGYTQNTKLNVNGTAAYLKKMLEQNGFEKITVKLFQEYSSFLARVEGMNSMAEIHRADTEKQEFRMRQIILNLSI